MIFGVREFLFGSPQFIPHTNIPSPRRESARGNMLFLPYLMSFRLRTQASLRPTVKWKKEKGKDSKKTVKQVLW